LATKERGIDYPVAVDNDYAMLERLRQPLLALYFIDADGIIRDHHFGEGRSGVARDSDIYDRGRGIGHCGKGRPWQRSLGGSLDGGASLARD
jgi:hypothetical protein